MEKYFNKMEELRNMDTCDIRDLTEYLVDSNVRGRNKQKTEKVQFSFVTKLLNIMNDAKYPIYDWNVVTIFKFTSPCQPDIKDKIDKYVKLYEIIQEVYKEVLIVYADKIASFRKVFDCNDVTDLRVVDIITWKLGEESLKKDQSISNQVYVESWVYPKVFIDHTAHSESSVYQHGGIMCLCGK